MQESREIEQLGAGFAHFDYLPLSEQTKKGLHGAGYTRMTEIQRAALPHALMGRDIVGAAKTGSGKTLAFLIPLVESLYRLRWGKLDGVGALILTPTKELGLQLFMELQKVGKYHTLSSGLLVGGRGRGGKDSRQALEEEQARIHGLNIIVCTPGRLLQHLDETVNFSCTQLQVLVMDEADRLLDEAFAATVDLILSQIPKQRQTLLFSATLTRQVQQLAQLNLVDPEYLAVHEKSPRATPGGLTEVAIRVPLHQKLDTLWSFIKMHLRTKTLVFLSSCKQVKFVYESFKRLRPGVPLACLHGRMKLPKRHEVYLRFIEAKYCVLFATDVAARGLDFPRVDWVVQVDCPEDAATYKHRVGRTARNRASGRSLLFLMPSEEEAMLELLEREKCPVKLKEGSKAENVSRALAALLAQDPELKYLAQRSFVTYLRSIHLQGNKEIFDVHKLPIEEFAASYGLPLAPRVRFLRKAQSRLEKNTPHCLKSTVRVDEDGDDQQEDELFRKKRQSAEGETTNKRLKLEDAMPRHIVTCS